MNKVIVYTTGCPQCKVLEQLLNAKHVSYNTCSDIDVMMSMGITAVPMMKVNDKLMNFQDSMAWIGGQCAYEN